MSEQQATQVLFVCTGNTCRSPLAEAAARQVIATGDLAMRAGSAGVSAVEGAPASADAQTAARELGLDLSKHRARLLTRAMVLESDVVLTMSEAQAQMVRLLVPEAADRVHRLGDYVGAEAGDVPDPYGGGLPVYRDTLNLFLAATRFKQPIGHIVRAILPLLALLLIGVLMVTYLPWLSTWHL